MFCPGCGLEDIQSNQFCRACGTELRGVRSALERPDNITASAATAREEIGRAFAAKIRDAQTAKELEHVAEDVLPHLEKFLESPAEKRMRRMRTGTLISSIGAGTTIALTIVGIVQKDEKLFFLAGLGLVCFFIGLSFILNAMLFTIPKKSLSDKSDEAESQRELDLSDAQTSDLLLPENKNLFSSVTENTTKHLKEKHPIPRR